VSALQKVQKLLSQFEAKKSVSPSEQQYLMNNIRQIIESKGGYKRKYSTINFYCNWTMHTALNTSDQCFQMLEEIQNVLLQSTEKGLTESENKERTNLFIKKASEIFSIDSLRNEFGDLFVQLKLPAFLFSSDNWMNFVRTLLYEINEKPICYPENVADETQSKTHSRAKKSYLRQLEKAKKHNMTPIDRFIVREIAIILEKDIYYWCIRTEPHLTFRGELKVTKPFIGLH